jgi:hypothetical protein
MAAAEWMELSEPAAAAMPLVVPPVHGRRTAPAKATIFFFKKFLPAQSNWERRGGGG